MIRERQYAPLILVVCVVAVVVAGVSRHRPTPSTLPTPESSLPTPAGRATPAATPSQHPIEPLRTPNLVGALTKAERVYRSTDLDDLTQEASDQPGFAQASHLIFERAPDETIQRGEILAKAHCTGCHGENLEEGEGHKILWAEEQYLRAGLRYNMGYKYGWRGPAVYRSIKYGTSNKLMPAFEGVLTEDEILAVAHYIRSIQCNNPETLKNR